MHPVLVVDDDSSILNTVRCILENNGLTVRTAGSGRACIEELEKGFKGLVLMDIVMPETDGWDTIEEAVNKGLSEGILFCMLTGKDVPDAKMDYLKEYVLDYITKPFNLVELVSVVKEYLSYLN